MEGVEEDPSSVEERKHFFKIIEVFKTYRHFNKTLINKRLKILDSLPIAQRAALKNYKTQLEQLMDCIDQNVKIIRLVVQDIEKMFSNLQHVWKEELVKPKISVADVEKVHVILKHFYRDWSKEGLQEREACYYPILNALDAHFSEFNDKEEIKVLVPGAGLGRLAFDIAKRGYTCQGNEFSLYMLFAANFVLNKSVGIEEYEIYPWATQFDNNMSCSDQTMKVKFPDVDPSLISSPKSRFSMIAGDFLEVYNVESDWDCITSCFFIDCANNIYTFIEKIYKLLKPGGVWINLGPLQYHFSSSMAEESIEPSYEVVKEIIKSVGFVFEEERTGIDTKYSQNPNSMLKMSFESVFFKCVKPLL